jgi:hypothetical protein
MRIGGFFLGVFTAVCMGPLFLAGCASPTAGDALYTIRYDGNGSTGGSVPRDNYTYQPGMTAIISGPRDLARTGYAFTGWNIKANGLGKGYQSGGSIGIETADVVLYAQWLLVPSYTLIYDGNGHTSGTVPPDSAEYYVRGDGTVLLFPNGQGTLEKEPSENETTESGVYVFAGWNTMADGSGTGYPVHYDVDGARYGKDAIEITENMDLILYAVWEFIPSGG